jgi:hypothetical protein
VGENEMSNVIVTPNHYLLPSTFAKCRDCNLTMLGILHADLRDGFCIDHARDRPKVDLKLCKGL